jgi:hypothetical protein
MTLSIFLKRTWIFISKLLLFLTILLICIFCYNSFTIRPKNFEKENLNRFFGHLVYLHDDRDIIELQNFTIKTITQGDNGLDHNPININEVLDKKVALCYEKSLILQKVMIMNNIRFRPVYLFHIESKKMLLP